MSNLFCFTDEMTPEVNGGDTNKQNLFLTICPRNMGSPYCGSVHLDTVKQKGLLDQNKAFTCANPP